LPVILSYRYRQHALPFFWVIVENPKAKKTKIVRMLADTGSCYTCFPRFYVTVLGLENHSRPEKPTHGIGCHVNRYIHEVKVSLFDPKPAGPSPPCWTSSLPTASFVDEINDVHGILGMDIISQWKEFCIVPSPNDETYAGEIRVLI
jgi:hypothetical protein